MLNELYPVYRQLLKGEGAHAVPMPAAGAALTAAREILKACNLCPRNCGVDRTQGELGFCKGGALAKVSSFGPHFGEESPLVGSRGSGTIFLAGCNLGCCFCQNYDISHTGHGREVATDELARMMLDLQAGGCHNINFVTPTHFTPQIMDAVLAAASRGLELPIVYNCGGYEAVETLRLLESIVDIYMPDFKFWDAAGAREAGADRPGSDQAESGQPDSAPPGSGKPSAEKYCAAPDYPEVARAALREMHRQVGDLLIKNGLALRGLLVRHLVMPGKQDETKGIFKFLADEISADTFVNVMDQYRPCYEADRFPEIARRITREELKGALEFAAGAGLRRVYS